MKEETPHVPIMQLWCYTSGTVNLTDHDFEHLLFCVECQTLLDQFVDILDHLPSASGHQAAA